jgi:hypothetical protein
MPIIDVRDEFNGGSGDLAGRVPDTMGRSDKPWVRLTGGFITGVFTLSGGFVESVNAPTLYFVGGPRSPNYRVVADVTGSAAAVVGVVARGADINNHYVFFRNSSGPFWALQKVVAGAVTTITSGAVAAGGFANVLELEVVGSRLTARMDGGQVAQVTDTAHSAAGSAGVYASAGATPGGRVFDFEVVDYTNPIRMVG